MMDNLALKNFGQFVYDYCGLNYLDKLTSLKMKTEKRLIELNINNYWEYIRYIENNVQEWPLLIDYITINETYFYREDKQFSELLTNVIPELLNTNSSINIWSAACSTGDEPYSIAFMLNNYLIQSNYNIKILGTDINERVLNIARSGKYPKSSLSFRRIPENWIKNYFEIKEKDYIVKNSIKQHVEFQYSNLYKLDGSISNRKIDIIFCRNVLIYFDDETVEKIVKSFYDILSPGGYLFLGHSESITKYNLNFKTINNNGTFYYKKEV